MEFLVDQEENAKCRKHPSRNPNGVCSVCLRNRLILLCPDCANVRPCGCYHAYENSSSSSSSASLSSSSGVQRSASVSGGFGRISFLIDAEPAFRRSRSAAFQYLGPKSGEKVAPTPGNRRWWSFTSLFKSDKTKKLKEGKKTAKLQKSRSVGVSCYSDPREVSGREIRFKGLIWQFPSPMKVFRQPKTAKFVQERSPLYRG